MNRDLLKTPVRVREAKGVRNGRAIKSATPASVRDVNRSIILSLIRVHEPISRVELSDRTGIFRSSVSAIVDELVGESLVIEQRATPKGRGRVPVNLFLNPKGFRVLGISIRPFQTSVAASGLTGGFEETVSFATPREPAGLLKELGKAVRGIGWPGNGFHEIGISVPGMVNAETGEILTVPSLREYADFPIAREVSSLLGAPASAENDCNLAALAEMWLNESEVAGVHDFVLVQIGDVGVGAGLIIGNELYGGHDHTWVGEFGHMIVQPDGKQCSCGRRGCWELYVSDRATWNRYDADKPYSPDRIEDLIRLAAGGDATARRALGATAEYLSLGITNIVMGLNPQRIVLAGEITKAWGLIGQTVESAYAPDRIRFQVYPARFGPEALALRGSVILALRRVFAPPKLG
ncbi:MAG TPA: ROK family transcriptional regulator [Bryobacteraceae bacterium]|nr:ROK family transcriptional regulator [Bryobacteraceae bacterium]